MNSNWYCMTQDSASRRLGVNCWDHVIWQCRPYRSAVQIIWTSTVSWLLFLSHYFGKPHETKYKDYNQAFVQLEKYFKERSLEHLICSLMVCIQDCVPIKLFVLNIVKFQQDTETQVTIVTFDEQLKMPQRRDYFSYW